ncbi:MAG: SGNH/GDSL hydrolase family protein [Chloroflexota bacterium]
MPSPACPDRALGYAMVRATAAVIFLATLLVGCGSRATDAPGAAGSDGLASAAPVTSDEPPVRYVALGDSYTIGTSVRVDERWTNQLVRALESGESTRIDLVANLGVNGYTSRDVIDVELPQLASLTPEFITLLIGVNDVVQGVPAETYRANVEQILDDLVRRVGAARILVVTTPDYTVTPSGADYGDPVHQAAGIRENNSILTTLAAARGIAVVDIHDISLAAGTDRSLVASDGLHPSGAQYALWVARIVPVVAGLLGLPPGTVDQ